MGLVLTAATLVPSGKGEVPTVGQGRFTVTFEGNIATFPKDADLPDVCFKCGTRDGLVRRSKTYSYKPVAILVPVANLATKTERASLRMPLCVVCDARHRRTFWLMIAMWLVPISSIVAAAFVGREDLAGVLGIASFVTIPVCGTVHWFYGRRRMAPGLVRIDRETITLGRFDPPAIEELRAEAEQR